MASPLLHQYQVEDVVQFLALIEEAGMRTKLQLVNRHIQLFVKKIMSKQTHTFETDFAHRGRYLNGTVNIGISLMTITELFNQITDGTFPPPPDYYHYELVRFSMQDFCPELEAILRAFKNAFRGCALWINYGYHSHDGNFPAPFTTQAQLIRILREMFEIFTDVTAIRLFGYNLSNFPIPFTPQADANNLMSIAEFLKVSSLEIHLKKSLGKVLTVPFYASHPQISEEDICIWLHANPNSRLVPRKMDIVIFYLNLAFIVKLVKIISENFSASTDLCPFKLSMKSGRDSSDLDQKGIAAGLIQLFLSYLPDIFSTSMLPEIEEFTNKNIGEIHQLMLKNKTTNETLTVEIYSEKVTIARHT